MRHYLGRGRHRNAPLPRLWEAPQCADIISLAVRRHHQTRERQANMLAQITTPAKINLYLAVKGKREDGYHEIETLFLPVHELTDTIRCQGMAEPGVAIVCNRPGVPTDQSNLVWRAAAAFAEASGVQPAWRFEIEKTIPVAAGLGGGRFAKRICGWGAMKPWSLDFAM